jgi:hypothetical protein
MELAFETLALRVTCESGEEARRLYPEPIADALQARLADIRSVPAVSCLVEAGMYVDAHPPGRVTFALGGGYGLVCIGSHPSASMTPEGTVDLARLRRLKVVAISREPQS